MDIAEVLNKLKLVEEENLKLQKELTETREHLKKYTAPTRSKTYYINHKEDIKQKTKEYKEKTNYVVTPEKVKEKNRKAYLKRKEKLSLIVNENI